MEPQDTAVDAAAQEAEILFPEQVVMIGPREVTVREFTYAESIRLARDCAALLEGVADEYAPDVKSGRLDVVIERHPDEWLRCLAVATDETLEWLETLSKADGRKLSSALWAANADFFCARLWRRLRPILPEPATSAASAESSPD